MCFYRFDSQFGKMKTATTDIVCWKRVINEGKKGVYSAPYYVSTKYDLRKTKSFKVKGFGYDETRTIGKGLHSYKTKARAEIYREYCEVIKRFVIPKGTKYFENHSQYVSLCIKYVKPKK